MTVEQVSNLSPSRRILLLVIIGAVSASLITTVYVFATTTSHGAQSSNERQIDDKIPKHVPIKYKLKQEKEKGFKDLTNDDWLEDFELEVTNASNKPIYFLQIWLNWHDVPDDNSPEGRRTGLTTALRTNGFH